MDVIAGGGIGRVAEEVGSAVACGVVIGEVV